MIHLPPGPLLFDTGIYIRYSRGRDYLWLGEDAQIVQRTILTAVVAAELYAGTRDLRKKELWINSASLTVPWVISCRRLRRRGLKPASGSVVPEGFLEILAWSIIFAIC